MSALTPSTIQHRKKMATYGKKTGSVDHRAALDFFDEDELSKPTRSLARSGQEQTKKPYTATSTMRNTGQKIQAKSAEAQARRSMTQRKKIDAFDVPSSEDEDGDEIVVRPALPRITAKCSLVDDRKEVCTRQTSWETSWMGTRHRKPPDPSACEKTELNDHEMADTSQAATPKKPRTSQRASSSASTPNGVSGMSARERLQARRKLKISESSSTPGRNTDHSRMASRSASLSTIGSTSTPRKRKRADRDRTSEVSRNIGDHATAPASANTASGEADEYAFVASSADELAKSAQTKERPRNIAKKSKVGAASSSGLRPRSKLERATSSSSHLPDRSQETEDFEFATGSSSLGTPSKTGTPDIQRATRGPSAPATPPSHERRSPQTAVRVATLTPKQSQLWSELLADETVKPSSLRGLSTKGVDLSETSHSIMGKKSVANSKPDITRRGTRLVDRLKASAVDFDDVSSGEDDNGDGTDTLSESAPEDSEQPEDKRVPTPSNTQSQQSVTADSGSRITYAQQRSYLSEDNLANTMLLDLPEETRPRPRAADRRGCVSTVFGKPSTFDMDDSDKNGDMAKIRSIHELRAAGKSSRITAHIEDLLRDISNHSVSAKSRRRSALLELADKLLEKVYVERFQHNSLDQVLLLECGAVSDPVADFALAVNCLLLVASDLPQHTLQTFKTAIPWLANMLGQHTDISKLVKDRKSNMSRAGQSDVLALTEKVKALECLWPHQTPSAVRPRTIALKTLDFLVGKLKRSGDRSELVDGEGLQRLVTPNSFGDDAQRYLDVSLDSSIVISVLESLSISSSPSNWPAPVMERIAALPTSLAETWNAPQHTRFLAYRLCLNVTNDASVDHSLFAQTGSVRHLLRAVADGFADLHKPRQGDVDHEGRRQQTGEGEGEESDQPELRLDLLVLAIGNLINLAEHSARARRAATEQPHAAPILAELVHVFRRGHARALDAESVEESASNVAYGYLAVMLANLCQEREVRKAITAELSRTCSFGQAPGDSGVGEGSGSGSGNVNSGGNSGNDKGGGLQILVDAVEEFVAHHQRVDMMDLEGGEGVEVWSVFTDRLSRVLAGLKEAVGS